MIKKILSELFDSFKKGEIPKIDFHLHTNWTDGKNSISEIYENAKKKGLKIIVFSEHVRNTSNWYQKFSSEVKNLPTKYCKAIAGCEAKILNNNGDLDLNNSILENSQAIMAVVHRFPGELGQIINDKKNISNQDAIKKELELTMNAIHYGKFDILGHPMGMSLKRFGLDIEDKIFEEIIVNLKEKNLAFEINSRYHKDPKKLLNMCLKNNCLISLGSNAHSLSEVGRIHNFL